MSKKKFKPTFFQKYKKWIYYGSFAASIIVILLLFSNSSLKDESSIPSDFGNSTGAELTKAPDFSLVTTDNKQLKLSDYRGKVLIVDFWATWCSPCRRGIPDLIELKKKYGPNGFEIIGISVDEETKEDVIPFIQQSGINYPVVYSDAGVTERYGGINSIPTSFVIDKEGKIIASYQGLTPKSVYEGHIKKLL